MIKIKTLNYEQTEAAGYLIGKQLKAGDVVLLEGDLGGGKTTFTKGIAKACGVLDTVNSPTFTIVKIYSGKVIFNHIDAYRLEGINDDIGIEELITDNEAITVIEWPNFIEDLLPLEHLKVVFTYLSEFEREITIIPSGISYRERFGDNNGNIMFR